ncbi:MAG: 1-phosphofructokinase [Propionibacteriaceae bacterium]|jgi:1-phosphofructokinase|nr:1-phosphofructokinase [Propionibacteriaceae bacterium]
MIVTVTVNPALDKTVQLDRLRPGQLNRVGPAVYDPGGKGVNVSRAIAALGGRSVATGFVGGPVGEELVRRLAGDPAIVSDFITVSGQTRTNLKLIDREHGLTELNEAGAAVVAAEAAQLERQLAGLAPGAIVVLAGSLCQGLPVDFYARLIQVVHAAGGLAYLDADGPALAAALGQRPDLIKPNRHELAQLAGGDDDPGTDRLIELARATVAQGIPRVVVSLGDQGAIFVTGEQVLRAGALAVPVRSTVGAGDAMVAALSLAAERNMDWPRAAAWAMACSAGAVTTAGTAPPDRRLTDRLLPQVRLETLRQGDLT